MNLWSRVARHRARWGIGFSLLTVSLVAWPAAAPATVAPYKGTLRVPPRAIRYRFADDTFAHQLSAFSMVRATRVGGDLAYTGSRLTQFHYIGPPGQGGMYEAMLQFKARRPLDPKNYQYRFRH